MHLEGGAPFPQPIQSNGAIMLSPSLGVKYLIAAGMVSACLQAAGPLQNGYMAGLFKRVDGDSKDRPLPPVQKLEQLATPHGLVIRDLRNGEQFTFQVLAAPPGSGTPSSQAVQAQKDLAEAFPADGATLVVPVDLTGSDVSDLLYARKGWGGWRVLSNGSRLPAPFPGFLDGFYDKGSGTARRDLIPADTHDLVVDDDLLAAVGDFLGNGTEQLAYTRPGWSQMWVVGAHGVVSMTADFTAIPAGGPGPRRHWLFPFRSKGTQHTRLAYYRMGSSELTVYAPRGMAFKRSQVPLKGNWEKLSQSVLDWPQAAPPAPAPGAEAPESKAPAPDTGR
jgi:hypothetical protein